MSVQSSHSHNENQAPPMEEEEAEEGSVMDQHSLADDNADQYPSPQPMMMDPASTPSESMVCLSVVLDGPRLAFCAYQEATNSLVLETCVSNGYETEGIVETVLQQLQPTLLLVSNQLATNHTELLQLLTTRPTDPPLAALLDDEDEEDQEAGEHRGSANPRQQGATMLQQQALSIPYRLLKSSAYDVRRCKALILQKLHVTSLQQQPAAPLGNGDGRRFPLAAETTNNNTQQQQQQWFPVSSYHALASVLDLDSTLQVQVVGSLLSFLQSAVFSHQPGITVDSIVQGLQASPYMTLSQATASALQIFATEHHPLQSVKGHGAHAKEGFSLFSLLDKTHSRAGRTMLRQGIMMRPLLNVEDIWQRQDGVELFCSVPETAQTLCDLLRVLAAVEPLIQRLQKCSTRPLDFCVWMRTLSTAVVLVRSLQELHFSLVQQQKHHPAVAPVDPDQPAETTNNNKIANYLVYVESVLQCCHVSVLDDLLQRLHSIVDEEATTELQSVVIQHGFSPELDEDKEKYAHLQDTLWEVAAILWEQFPQLKNLMKVIFMPQVGFLVSLMHHPLWMENPGTIPPHFELVFVQEGYTCYKCPEVRELDATIGDLDSQIKDQETLIVAELEDDILDCEAELRETFHALAELDCILAFASLAVERGFVRPIVVPASENCIQIRNGRHPLQEIIVEESFVPNDAMLDVDQHRVNVVTGPNFSGKSCYARQVGLLVYMAQIGCFLPCDAARISVTEQILARFSSVETCAVPQSSFQLDLTQMGSILRHSGPNTLVLIDEFGKGTSPASGIALLASSLRYLSQVKCKVICTTHFLEMFSMGLLVDGQNGVKALRMGVQVPETTNDIAVPLFKLERGVASSSAGLVCAKMAGVKQAVIDRANEIIQAVKDRRPVQPLTEILRGSLGLSPFDKGIVDQFIATDWAKASEDDLRRFLSKLN